MSSKKEETPEIVAWLLWDSGSQSTSCSPSFAPQYSTDDSERVCLWDIQDHPIHSCGKKIVDVCFVSEDGSQVDGSICMDVSDVGNDGAPLGRFCRAGFDLHFTNLGHVCWMERDNLATTLFEDDPNSESPLDHLKLQIKPIPEVNETIHPGELIAGTSRTDLLPNDFVTLVNLEVRPELNGLFAKCLVWIPQAQT